MSKRRKLNTIRIIGGEWRGRRIGVAEVDGLRPTIDRVRETVFNWLMHDIAGARCLDLFAGTGVLGLESLSRGAKFVQFVEQNQVAYSTLQGSLSELLLQQERANVQQQSALSVLANPPAQSYDVVFLDPPFQSGLLDKSIQLLIENNWLSDRAMIYIERSSKSQHDDLLRIADDSWALYREGEAGESSYCLYIA